MKRNYIVSKDEKTNLWYAHLKGFPYVPVFGSFKKQKRHAQKYCADMMHITLKEYLTLK